MTLTRIKTTMIMIFLLGAFIHTPKLFKTLLQASHVFVTFAKNLCSETSYLSIIPHVRRWSWVCTPYSLSLLTGTCKLCNDGLNDCVKLALPTNQQLQSIIRGDRKEWPTTIL